jgi:hypothetical protein
MHNSCVQTVDPWCIRTQFVLTKADWPKVILTFVPHYSHSAHKIAAQLSTVLQTNFHLLSPDLSTLYTGLITKTTLPKLT